MRAIVHLVVVVLIAFSCSVVAQNTSQASRRTIGLALDAGGANGLAHAGFLMWMDEHRVPVDYIAGTSMGSIIGGAYATGMPARDIRTMISRVDWSTVLRGETDYRDMSFRRKQDRRDVPVSLEMGLKHGLSMPGGLNSGQHVDRLISQFALPYSEMQSFDELPIPFRCVATDLDSGEAYVFKQGTLADAIRASMSLPGIFEPVRIAGRTFVDGTLLDPLPVGEARKLGADVVIAVYLDTYSPKQEMTSPFAVVKRSIQAVTLEFERQSMRSADHVVKVDLLDTDNTEYEKWERIIARGYAAAEKNAELLLRYAMTETEWQQYLQQREARRIKLHGVAHPIVSSNAQLSPASLAAVKAAPLNQKSLDRAVGEIEGTGRYSRVRPRITNTDGVLTVGMEAFEKSYGPGLFVPQLLIDGSDYNNVRFSAGGRMTIHDFVKAGGEMRTDITLGSLNRFGSELYLPWGKSRRWFTTVTALASNAPMDTYAKGGKISEYRVIESSGEVGAGYAFNCSTQLALGYGMGWIRYSGEVGAPLLPTKFKGTEESASLRFIADHRDDPIVALRGVLVESLFNYYRRHPLAAEAFPSLEVRLSGYLPISAKSSIFAKATAGSTFGFNSTGLPMFSLGGPSRMAAYGTNEAMTNQFAYVSAGYRRQIAHLSPMVGKGVYLDTAVELAKTCHTPALTRVPIDVKTAVISQTALGPIEVGAAFGDSGHRKFYFQIGRVF